MASPIEIFPANGTGRTQSEAPAARVEYLAAEATARRRLRRLEAEVLAPARGLSEAAARLRWIVSGYVSLAIDEPGVMTLFAGDRARWSARLRARIDGALRALENDLTEVSLTQAEVSKIDPTVAALSLLGIVHWGVCSFRTEGRLSREDAVEQISHLALHGLVRPPAHTQPKSPGGPGHRAIAA